MNQNGEASAHCRTKEYRAWWGMRMRCYNRKNPKWTNYGRRGITVCDRWLSSYLTFLFDMGRAPTIHHSIDRIDNDKGYGPLNCRWATASQRARNKQTVKLQKYEVAQIRDAAVKGVTHELIAKKFRVSRSLVSLIHEGRRHPIA